MTKQDDAKSSAQAVWGATPAGTTWAPDHEPGTKAFFDEVKLRRSTVEMPWLHVLVDFPRYRDADVLELGCGAGYDAFEFARAGARYTGVDITPENIARTQAHLAFYGFRPALLQADAERLPFEDATFDLVFSNGVLHHTPDIAASFAEAWRVLRPGGEFCVLLYHRNSVFYRIRIQLYEQIIKGGRRRQTDAQRLSEIEYTTSGAYPLVNVYSRGDVARLLRDAGFRVRMQRVRKLVPHDFPLVIGVNYVITRLPQSWLDAIGSVFGWYVLTWAIKPSEEAP